MIRHLTYKDLTLQCLLFRFNSIIELCKNFYKTLRKLNTNYKVLGIELFKCVINSKLELVTTMHHYQT